MGIDNHLKVIKEGVFGRDVRKAIHDGIEQVYEDATFDGNANMEVAKARGYAGTLSERLAGVDYDLAQARNDISTHSNRLDAIIAHAGDGSVPSELIDMRVGANDITYATSGTAVRSQLANLSDRLDATDEL